MRRTVRCCALAGCVLVARFATASPAHGWDHAALFGADVRSLAIDPRDPERILAGTSAGQVYLSLDGGESWTDAGAALPFPHWVVGTLVFDPNQTERLWAGLWGIWGGGLVAYSDDLGRSWAIRHAAFPEDRIYALAPVPGSPGHLYAATRQGVLATADGGATWQLATRSYPEIINVSSLFIDPLRPQTLIAGTWRRAYRSDDGGLSWRGIFQGMVEDSEVFSLHSVPWNPGELWASTCGWVYQTLDWGEHWARFKQGFEERRTPSFAVLVGGRLVAGTVQGAYTSEDQGRNWTRRTAPDLAVLSISHHPARPQRVVLGTEGGGVWLSNDGGLDFHRASLGLYNLRVMALLRSRDAGGEEVLAAVNHAGPASGIYVSRDGGRSFAPQPQPLPTVLDLAAAADGVYAATEKGLWGRGASGWKRIDTLGEARIEQLLVAGDRVVVRTAKGFFERRKDRFQPLPYKHGPPRSAALLPRALWVSDAEGIYRLAGTTNHSIATPFSGGRLDRLGAGLLLSGAGGAWLGRDLGPDWRLLAEGPVRALATGDSRYPMLLLDDQGARLLDASSGALLPIELPGLARDVAAALIVNGRLLLGTSGYGLLSQPLPGPAAGTAN